MNHGGERLLRVEDNGVFYMAVGALKTTEGIGWFDHAVLFCPFCGIQLQTRDEIARARPEALDTPGPRSCVPWLNGDGNASPIVDRGRDYTALIQRRKNVPRYLEPLCLVIGAYGCRNGK